MTWYKHPASFGSALLRLPKWTINGLKRNSHNDSKTDRQHEHRLIGPITPDPDSKIFKIMLNPCGDYVTLFKADVTDALWLQKLMTACNVSLKAHRKSMGDCLYDTAKVVKLIAYASGKKLRNFTLDDIRGFDDVLLPIFRYASHDDVEPISARRGRVRMRGSVKRGGGSGRKRKSRRSSRSGSKTRSRSGSKTKNEKGKSSAKASSGPTSSSSAAKKPGTAPGSPSSKRKDTKPATTKGKTAPTTKKDPKGAKSPKSGSKDNPSKSKFPTTKKSTVKPDDKGKSKDKSAATDAEDKGKPKDKSPKEDKSGKSKGKMKTPGFGGFGSGGGGGDSYDDEFEDDPIYDGRGYYDDSGSWVSEGESGDYYDDTWVSDESYVAEDRDEYRPLGSDAEDEFYSENGAETFNTSTNFSSQEEEEEVDRSDDELPYDTATVASRMRSDKGFFYKCFRNPWGKDKRLTPCGGKSCDEGGGSRVICNPAYAYPKTTTVTLTRAVPKGSYVPPPTLPTPEPTCPLAPKAPVCGKAQSCWSPPWAEVVRDCPTAPMSHHPAKDLKLKVFYDQFVEATNAVLPLVLKKLCGVKGYHAFHKGRKMLSFDDDDAFADHVTDMKREAMACSSDQPVSYTKGYRTEDDDAGWTEKGQPVGGRWTMEKEMMDRCADSLYSFVYQILTGFLSYESIGGSYAEFACRYFGEPDVVKATWTLKSVVPILAEYPDRLLCTKEIQEAVIGRKNAIACKAAECEEAKLVRNSCLATMMHCYQQGVRHDDNPAGCAQEVLLCRDSSELSRCMIPFHYNKLIKNRDKANAMAMKISACEAELKKMRELEITAYAQAISDHYSSAYNFEVFKASMRVIKKNLALWCYNQMMRDECEDGELLNKCKEALACGYNETVAQQEEKEACAFNARVGSNMGGGGQTLLEFAQGDQPVVYADEDDVVWTISGTDRDRAMWDAASTIPPVVPDPVELQTAVDQMDTNNEIVDDLWKMGQIKEDLPEDAMYFVKTQGEMNDSTAAWDFNTQCANLDDGMELWGDIKDETLEEAWSHVLTGTWTAPDAESAGFYSTTTTATRTDPDATSP